MKAKITDRLIATLNRAPQSAYYVCDEVIKGFRLVIRPSGSISFIFCYRNDEGRSKKYTIGKFGSLTTTQARDIAKLKSAEVRTGLDIQGVKKSAREDAKRLRKRTLKTFYEEQYLPYCLSHMKSGKKRAQVIKRHFVDRWPDKPLTDINTWLLSSWVTEKRKLNYSPAGVNHPTSALKALLNKAVEWDVIESNPLSKFKALKSDTLARVRYLTESEELNLRSALDQRQTRQRTERESYRKWCKQHNVEAPRSLLEAPFTDHLKPMVILALNTGMRRGEIFSLQRSDINLNEKILTIRGEFAKNSKTRHLPLNREAFQNLENWLTNNKNSDLVFPSPKTGKKMDNINKSWKGLLKAAEIKNFRFHDLRHHFASKLVMKGANLYTVKELLGHSSIELTQRYAHLSPDHKADAVALLG